MTNKANVQQIGLLALIATVAALTLVAALAAGIACCYGAWAGWLTICAAALVVLIISLKLIAGMRTRDE